MNQQQNKHSSKNNKKNSIPAKIICTDYVGLDENGDIRANFQTEEEIKSFMQKHNNLMYYKIVTYRLNNKKINIKNKISED